MHQSNGRFYKRIRSGTVRLDELHDISKREKTEEVILPEITQDDLNLELFDKARAIASTNKSNHMWITMSNEEIIRGSNLVGYDRSSRKYYYNIAAVLLLGKDETITRILPGYKFEIFVRKEDIYRWDDRKTFRTNLIDTRIEALDFITDNLKESYFDEGGQRKDLRDQIFKEIVGNVIIHREYSDAMATEIVISKDSVVSTNPNIIHQSGLLDLDTFEHYPKNPKILGFFKEMGWSEEAGTGVKNVTRYLNIYVRGAVPEFFEDNPFVTTIPLKSHLLGERYIFLLELFDIMPSEFSSDKAALLKNGKKSLRSWRRAEL